MSIHDVNDFVRNFRMPNEEGYPTLCAAELADLVNDAVLEDDTIEAFNTIMDMREKIASLEDDEVEWWGELKPIIDDPNWDTFFKAVVKEEFDSNFMNNVPSWASPKRLEEPWEPVEPLNEGAGPFDYLNIVMPAEDYYGAADSTDW